MVETHISDGIRSNGWLNEKPFKGEIKFTCALFLLKICKSIFTCDSFYLGQGFLLWVWARL